MKQIIPIPETPDEYKFVGLIPEIFYSLEKILNFTFVLTMPKDGKYDGKVNGTRVGIAGDLLNGKIDIGTQCGEKI